MQDIPSGQTEASLRTELEQLRRQNLLLGERVEAQQDMLKRTTEYMAKVETELKISKREIENRSELLELLVKQRTEKLMASLAMVKEESLQRKMAQEKLERLNNELNTFIYRSSHDLKGPVRSALGLLYLLGKNGLDADTFTHRMNSSLTQLNAVLDRLIAVVDLKSATLSFSEFKPSDFIRQCFEEVKLNIRLPEATAATLSLRCYPPDKVILSDSRVLHILFTELFYNSLFFSIKCNIIPQLTVTGRYEDDMLELYVEDNGPGFPEHLREQLFDMFYKASEHSEGTGLGLFLCRSAVDKLEGKIDIQNITDNGRSGTVVFVKIKTKCNPNQP